MSGKFSLLVHKALWQNLPNQKKAKSKKKNRSSERNDFLHIENEFSVFEGSKLPLGLEFNLRLKNLDALYKYSLEKINSSLLSA